jgi:hypothetical protein
MIIGTLPGVSAPMISRSHGIEDELQESRESDPVIMADCDSTSCITDEEVYLLVLSKRCHVAIITWRPRISGGKFSSHESNYSSDDLPEEDQLQPTTARARQSGDYTQDPNTPQFTPDRL